MIPLLFGQHGKDEIVVGDGQELVLPLGAAHEAFALHAAGSDGDPGLDLLIALAPRIPLGIEECRDSGLLIVLQRELPGKRRNQEGGERDDAEQPQRQAGQVGDAEEHRDQGHGRAEVGLLGDEQQQDAGEDAACHHVAGVARPAAILSEVHGQDERQHHPAEFRRLQVERADRDPALRAHLGRALQEHEQQQRQQPAVEEQRVLREHPVVECRNSRNATIPMTSA